MGKDHRIRLLFDETTSKNLDLSLRGYLDDDASAMALGLKDNSIITSLNLSWNFLRIGAELIVNCIPGNHSLRELNLTGNDIGNNGVIILGNVLNKSISLQKLHLAANNVTDPGVITLSEALKENTILEELNMAANSLQNGAVNLVNSLKLNTTLKILDISHNKIKNAGATKIAKILANQTSLQTLYIDGNDIFEKGKKKLASFRTYTPPTTITRGRYEL